jgi:hypothetical protein
MENSKNPRSGPGSIRFLLVGLTICALTASLVTRTFRVQALQNATAQSNSPQAVRQHLDRDATQWAPPVLHFTPLPVFAFSPHAPSVWLRFPSLLLDESLYNRPPPSC